MKRQMIRPSKGKKDAKSNTTLKAFATKRHHAGAPSDDRVTLGQLREMGSHQELLAQRGLYWKLYQLQYKDQELRANATKPAPLIAPASS